MLPTGLSLIAVLTMAACTATSLLTMLICWKWLRAGRATAALLRDFESSPPMKRLRDLEASIPELSQQMDSLLASHKRLRSREGMAAMRERRSAKPETKAEARARIFGAAAGPAFARIQQGLSGDPEG